MAPVSRPRAPVRTSGPPCLPAAEIADVAERWRNKVCLAAPHLAASADKLLTRISPPHWALEWSLPYWLGQALDLKAADQHNLILSNVMGLAYVRLQDDLIDHDLEGAELETAPLLSTVLHELWMRCYLDLFGADARFWDWYGQCMREWTHATWLSLNPSARPFRSWGADEFLQLARLGAPLKICVTGACLLADAAERSGPITGALDALLAGAVLLDHAYDWEDDLGRPRFNAFHLYATGSAGHALPRDELLRFMLHELVIGDAGKPYVRRIRGQFQAAAEQAEAAGIPELAAFARWLHGRATDYGKALARHARDRLHEAVAPVLSASIVGS